MGQNCRNFLKKNATKEYIFFFAYFLRDKKCYIVSLHSGRVGGLRARTRPRPSSPLFVFFLVVLRLGYAELYFSPFISSRLLTNHQSVNTTLFSDTLSCDSVRHFIPCKFFTLSSCCNCFFRIDCTDDGCFNLQRKRNASKKTSGICAVYDFTI